MKVVSLYIRKKMRLTCSKNCSMSITIYNLSCAREKIKGKIAILYWIAEWNR